MTCIIIEDEIPAQRILKTYLEKLPNLELKGVFKAAIEANSYLNSSSVDLIFLDINLPDLSGLDFIKTVSDPPSVIVTTAYPDYAVESFELDTIVDYLVKPIPFERFLKAVNKARRVNQADQPTSNVEAHQTPIFLNVDKTLHKIILENILYIESDRNYITLVTDSKRLTYIESLKSWKEKLDSDQFIQVHKSFIINRKRVDKIVGNVLHIAEQRIPIGRTYKQALLQKLNIT